MAIDQQLLDILVCPQCRGGLVLVEGGRGLLCEKCQLKYPVRNDIPMMLVEEALDLKSGQKAVREEISWDIPSTNFKIVAGPNAGTTFHLDMGTCKAIGRSVADPNKTAMFAVDLTLSLDENTKRLILEYITRQFRKSQSAATKETGGGGSIGSFKRAADVIVDDPSISRLHAMIFYDDVGVGILDLVSKNGTFVNGEEVESRLLRKNDMIEVGETKINFEG